MKKIMLFAAACVALAACSKEIDTTTPEIGSGTAFEKGQKVTLTVKTGDQTKVSSELVTSGEDKDKVNFAWETGDKIKVTVGTKSAEFTLTSGAGYATAEFTGTMPATGETFDVQYPVDDPDLSSQTYVANGLPKDKMKMAATGCTLGNSFTLTPQYAALRLNLYADCTIGKIEVTDKTASLEQTYTLICTGGVKNNSGNETMPFFVVLPSGNMNFEAKVYGTGDTPSLICTRATTIAQTFKNGEILNMPLKYDYPGTDLDKITIGTTVWAPVNCGYVPKTGDSGAALGYPYGKLYQWGRKYGQGHYEAGSGSTPTYEDADYPGKGGSQTLEKLTNTSDKLTTHPDGDTYNGKYYWNQFNWYQGGGTGAPAVDELWGASKTTYDPCPDGWRVPTDAELTALMGSHTSGDLQDGNHGSLTNIKGKYFDGSTAASPTSGVFLPAAGWRDCINDGSALSRGTYGYYWSSSVCGSDAWRLRIGIGSANMNNSFRAYGFSVRCVQE